MRVSNDTSTSGPGQIESATHCDPLVRALGDRRRARGAAKSLPGSLAAMARLGSALGQAVRTALRLDRTKIALGVGLRVAIGVGLCLVVGRLSGHTVAGVTATIGALSAGMASHQGTYRSRAAIVLAAAASMGACATVGGAVGQLFGPDVAVTALVSFGAGLLISLGNAGLVVGLQAVVGLVVFSQFHLSWAVSLRNGGLVLLGGAVQALLVVVVWPLRRFPAERRALSDAYGVLAGYSRALAADAGALLEPGSLDGLDALWRDAQPFGGDDLAAHRALAAQTDRLRLELVALARARVRLAVTGEAVAARAVDEVFERSAAVLDEVAAAVADGRAPAGWQEQRLRFRSAQETLQEAAAARPTDSGAAALDVERRVEALAGQLRAVLRTAAVPAGFEAVDLDELMRSGGIAPARRSGATWVREQGATLRSNLTLSSQACRHALRMAVAMAAGVAISHIFTYGHRYWLPMTVLLVLRPDFASTVTRGLSRVIGTLIGAGAVTALLAELRPGPDWLIALVVALCFPAAALLLANYAIFSVCIASLVVTMLAFLGAPELATAGDRTFYTLAGAAVALIAYAAWPTWESTSLPDTLAGLAETEGRYAAGVLRAWAEPSTADRAGLQKARLDARLARSNAEAAVTRWLSEPDTAHRLPRETVLGFMASVRACVQALLALHAELPEAGPGQPEVGRLASEVEQAFSLVAGHLRGSAPVSELPRLRRRQLALAARLEAGSDGPRGDPGAVVLAGETDLLVDSVDALGHLVGLVS